MNRFIISEEQLENIIEAQLGQIIESENNTMTFWHGGNLDDYNQGAINQKAGRYEYGPGLYLITKYSEAIKYAKGSRKLYKVTVEKGNNISKCLLNYLDVEQFISKFAIKNKRSEVLSILTTKKDNEGKIKANIFLNLMVNFDAIKPSNTKHLRQFLVDNSVDYEIVSSPFGWGGEYMLVLYNMDKIKKIDRVMSYKNIEQYDLGDSINESTNKRPTITFLVGPPASGKSTWVQKNANNSTIVSRDDIVDLFRQGTGMSYSETFKDKNFQDSVNKQLQTNINNAINSNKDIVVDMTNMNKNARGRILNRLPNNYLKKAVVFNVNRDELIKRLEKRKLETGKEVGIHVVDSMINSFEMPGLDEFDYVHFL